MIQAEVHMCNWLCPQGPLGCDVPVIWRKYSPALKLECINHRVCINVDAEVEVVA